MTKTIHCRNRSTAQQRKCLPLILCLILSLLVVGCSALGVNPADSPKKTSGGRSLPPAWTPTPITIPGTGLDIGTWNPCEDAPASQLEIGDIAIVQSTSLKLRLRGEPSLNGTLAGEIAPGDLVEVFNGPNCSDKLVWWEIRSLAAGQTGWAAEGNDYNTWLLRKD